MADYPYAHALGDPEGQRLVAAIHERKRQAELNLYLAADTKEEDA